MELCIYLQNIKKPTDFLAETAGQFCEKSEARHCLFEESR